ncbi:MAG: SIR2 family NAD-dependent protein deacylase [Alphaproteobacteria bacterium]
MSDELYITGAGVSSASGIPTFRGEDGFWTIGSINYTPQEMATRQMYLNNPGQFLLWYFKRFIAYKDAKPNAVHKWLSKKKLITQNIDGLDAKAGNESYISIHGRLDKLVVYDDEMKLQTPINANWNEIDKNLNSDKLILSLFDKFKITKNTKFIPKFGFSLKPYVLLFDEMYTDIYRFSEAEEWMNMAKKMIFIGTSFSVNITSIALRIGISNNIPIEIIDPKPMKLNYPNIKYFEMSGEEYCKLKEGL